MAHFMRGKQVDLSAGLKADAFNVDIINRFGINSQVAHVAYDPVQSLIALGTNETKFGPDQVYVFGQKRVNAVLPLARRASVRALHFCVEKLLCLDSKNELTIFSLEEKRAVASYSPPGTVTALHCDPTLDYALLGMQNGEILAYDLDRLALAPFRLPNLQNFRSRIAPVVCLALHPRDMGTLLIGYPEGACQYSFKQNQATHFYRYELPQGAPGGDGNSAEARSPRLTHAIWHPTGTFILTGHDDGSLVFWDPNDGRILCARTLTDTGIDKPSATGRKPSTTASIRAGFGNDPLEKIIWCANSDPDDTALLICGGSSSSAPSSGLTLFEFGRTPNYNTSSWQVLSQHLENPRRQRILPTPPNAQVLSFCLIPRSSPHFHNAQDPIAISAILSSGELITLSFPSGLPITPTNQLSVSMTFLHPYVTKLDMSPVKRTRWLGMTEKRSHGPKILEGGAPAPQTHRRFEERNILQTAHADGTIRLWDAGRADEVENDAVVQADLSFALGRQHDLEVVSLSLAAATGELAAGLRNGELVVFRWGHNKTTDREPPPQPTESVPGRVTNIADRKDPTLSEGLFPFMLLDEGNGPVTAVKLSEVGFVAAGFEGGNLVVIDLRGPAVIHRANVTEFIKPSKPHTLRKASIPTPSRNEYATALEFSVMTADDDAYSSIMLHAGTSAGNVATFKLLPEPSGRYAVQHAGTVAIDDSRVIKIAPIGAATGEPAQATQQAVAGLRDGVRVTGLLLAVTQTGARLFKPAAQHKTAHHKSFDNVLCHSAAVTRIDDTAATALVALFGDGAARAFSLPALRELAKARVDAALAVARFGDAVVAPSGDVVGWTGPSEVALVNVWSAAGAGSRSTPKSTPSSSSSKDALFNPDAVAPPRPTISNLQWMAGTRHVSSADMDLLIAGPERPPSKRLIRQQRADALAAGGSAGGGGEEGYWDYMTRQISERTEKLGLMGESVERLQDNAAAWSGEASKYVAQQKRSVLFGGELLA